MDKLTELNREYWGRVHDMCKDTNVKPWECVKLGCRTPFGNQHPIFNCAPTDYKFAVTILEDKPVFVGNYLFDKILGEVLVESSDPYGNLYLLPKECVKKRRPEHTYMKEHDSIHSLSWQPHSPKRTFDLNGAELPCPATFLKEGEERHMIQIHNNAFYYKNIDDYNKVTNALINLLTEARDK